MARIDEVGPDLYRICIYVPEIDLQFNHFLVKDEGPLLFHTGMRRMFPEVRDAVAQIIDPADLRWISWSHFEVDECGALNEWLAVAPQATPVCSECGAMVNLTDFSNRPPRGLKPGEILETGRHRFRYVQGAVRDPNQIASFILGTGRRRDRARDGCPGAARQQRRVARDSGNIRQMPSMRIQFTLTDAGPGHRVLGEYVLEHSSPSG